MVKGQYSLIILDAMYRMLPDGMSENDNAAMAQVYNRVNRYAAMSGAAIVIVHHSTKGSQEGKDVVDVGSGAGSMSRAADTHLVLRAHEESDAAVLEAAVRSWAPVQPLGIRWTFPIWQSDENLNPEALKGKTPPREERQQAKDAKEAELVFQKLVEKGPATVKRLIGFTGIGRQRLERLLGVLQSNERVSTRPVTIRGNKCDEYSVA
jgi:RecA-family ATPase